MNDLISRRAAIDALCAVCGKACDKSKFVYNAPQDEQVILCPEHYCLCTLPSAQPVQWIPCSERLPDKSGTYICNCVESDINHVTFIKWQSRYKRWDLNGRRTFWRVTAWKPIPEPYERRQDEQTD